MIELCLCTHNPRRDVLDVVLRSIAAQIVPEGEFLFLLVDNASSPAVPETVLTPLRDRGISSRLVQESRPGIFHARNRAMRESKLPLILWVDDDTEFPPDHVSKCLTIARQHPEIGCFGGKLRLDPQCRFPDWTVPIICRSASALSWPSLIAGKIRSLRKPINGAFGNPRRPVRSCAAR